MKSTAVNLICKVVDQLLHNLSEKQAVIFAKFHTAEAKSLIALLACEQLSTSQIIHRSCVRRKHKPTFVQKDLAVSMVGWIARVTLCGTATFTLDSERMQHLSSRS